MPNATSLYNILPAAQDCYCYISHLDTEHQVWYLPNTPETISDSMSSTFADTNALGRSAPVFTYSNSGPRTVQVNLQLHRDMMDMLNAHVDNTKKADGTPTDREIALQQGRDTVDELIRALQSISVPKYNLDNRAVEPPLVAFRFGREVFIKGIVSGAIGVEYNLPILYNGKYAQVKISFTVTEVDPYDATTIFANGSFRGLLSQVSEKMGISEE